MTQPALGFRKATVTSDVAGDLHISARPGGVKTQPGITKHSGLLRLMRPLWLDDSGQLTYIIVNTGGAYFSEKYQMRMDVEPGANMLVASQGATRIHKTPKGHAEQDITFTVGEGARLEYMPDQTIAYKDADYRQYSRVEMAPGAQAFFGEIVTPGWDPDDVRFTYTNIHLRMEVVAAESGKHVLIDNVRVRPADIGVAISGTGYFEGASHMSSVLVIGPQTRGEYTDKVREIVDGYTDIQAGVSNGTRHGVSWLMVRALGDSTDTLNRLMLDVNEYDRSLTTGQARLNMRRY